MNLPTFTNAIVPYDLIEWAKRQKELTITQYENLQGERAWIIDKPIRTNLGPFSTYFYNSFDFHEIVTTKTIDSHWLTIYPRFPKESETTDFEIDQFGGSQCDDEGVDPDEDKENGY